MKNADVLKILDHHSTYMIQAGTRIMNLANSDVCDEFSDIGIEKYSRLLELLHQIWMEGLALSRAATREY